MNATFDTLQLIGFGSLAITAGVLYLSLRRSGWYRRILPGLGLLFSVFGLLGGCGSPVGGWANPAPDRASGLAVIEGIRRDGGFGCNRG